MADKKLVAMTPYTLAAVKEVADLHARNKRIGEGEDRLRKTLPTDLVRIRNDSGGNRRAGDVLELGARLNTAEDLTNEFAWFVGDTPTGTEKFGILRRAVPDGEIGDLQVSGCCKAWIDINDADHTRAKVVAASHVLESSTSGPYKILWQPGSTGEQECFVVLDEGSGGGGGLLAMGKLVNDMCMSDRCATVTCIVGTEETLASACNPLRHQGEAGDIVLMAAISLIGAGYDADCPTTTPTGCTDPDDNPICLPCDDDDEDTPCDVYNEAQDAKWVIIDVQKKCVGVYAGLENRDNCLVGGKIQLAGEICLREVCGEVITELEPVSSPTECTDVNVNFTFDEVATCPTALCCGFCTFPTLQATLTAIECDCLTSPVTITLFYDDVDSTWKGTSAAGGTCSDDITLHITCGGTPESPSWTAEIQAGFMTCTAQDATGGSSNVFTLTGTCSPLDLSGTADGMIGIGCCGAMGGENSILVEVELAPPP